MKITWQESCRELRVKKPVKPEYHPWTNSIVQWLNGTNTPRLHRSVAEQQQNLDSYVMKPACAYDTPVHSALKLQLFSFLLSGEALGQAARTVSPLLAVFKRLNSAILLQICPYPRDVEQNQSADPNLRKMQRRYEQVYDSSSDVIPYLPQGTMFLSIVCQTLRSSRDN